MVTVSRRDILPLLAPILGPTAFSMLAPNPIQAGETQSFLLAIAPVKHHSPWTTWLGDLDHSLTTNITQQRSMPNEKFSILYPRLGTTLPTKGGRT